MVIRVPVKGTNDVFEYPDGTPDSYITKDIDSFYSKKLNPANESIKKSEPNKKSPIDVIKKISSIPIEEISQTANTAGKGANLAYKLVTGRDIPQSKKDLTKGNIASDAINIASLFVPVARGASLAGKIAINSGVQGGAAGLSSLFRGESQEDAGKNAISAAATQGVLDTTASKLVPLFKKAVDKSIPPVAQFGSAIISKNVEDYEKVLRKEIEGKSILKGPERKSGIIKMQAEKAHEKYKDLQNKTKSELDAASQTAISFFNDIISKAGQNIGEKRLGLNEKVAESSVNPFNILSTIDDIIKNSEVPAKEVGKNMKAFGGNRIGQKELKLLNTIKDELTPYYQSQKISPNQLKIINKMAATTGNMPAGVTLPSSAILDKYVLDLQEMLDFNAKNTPSSGQSYSDSALKKLQTSINETLGKIEPDFKNAKSEFSGIKDIQSELGTKFKNINSIKRLISQYAKGQLNSQEIDALESLNKRSNNKILGFLDNKPGVEFSNAQVLENLKRLNNPKPAQDFLKQIRNQPDEIQNALNELDPSIRGEIENQLSSNIFYDRGPGMGGGSGSGEGFMNLFKNELVRAGGAGMAALGLTQNIPASMAIGASFIPYVHRKGIRTAGMAAKLGRGADKLFQNQIIRNVANKSVNSDGSNTPKSIEQLRAERGIR